MSNLILTLAFALAAATPAASAAAAEEWPVPDWQVASPESQGLSAEGVAAVEKWHAENASRTGLVIRHGRIVGEWYFGDTDPGIETRRLFHDEELFQHRRRDGDRRQETHARYADRSVFARLRAGGKETDQRWPIAQHDQRRAKQSRTRLAARPFRVSRCAKPRWKLDPARNGDYNNTGLAMLSPLFRAATGEAIDQYLDARVFRPIGIAPSDWTWEQNAGYPLPFSGLHITARALARFGLLVLREGRWQDRQIVAADWLATAVRPSQSLDTSYSYLWWNNTTGKWPGVPADAFAAIGFLDNDLLIVPSLDLIVIRQVGDKPLHDRPIKIADLFQLAAHACHAEPSK